MSSVHGPAWSKCWKLWLLMLSMMIKMKLPLKGNFYFIVLWQWSQLEVGTLTSSLSQYLYTRLFTTSMCGTVSDCQDVWCVREKSEIRVTLNSTYLDLMIWIGCFEWQLFSTLIPLSANHWQAAVQWSISDKCWGKGKMYPRFSSSINFILLRLQQLTPRIQKCMQQIFTEIDRDLVAW